MKKITITLIMVSGLYISKTHASTITEASNNPNIELLSQEVIDAADSLFIESPMTRQDKEVSKAFNMELISEMAGQAADDIQNTIDIYDPLSL